MVPKRIAGDLYADVAGQILEIKRQLRKKEGCPYDPMQLVEHLQAAIEGNLVDRHGKLFRNESISKFKIWKNIRLGTGLNTADDFCKAFKCGNFRISDYVTDILASPAFTVAAKATMAYLVKVSLADLGFRLARIDQIYMRAAELGLKLCPAEVGPQLRLQYSDQQEGEDILVAMEPINTFDSPRFFGLESDKLGRWIYCALNYPDHIWDSGTKWVFIHCLVNTYKILKKEV